MKSLEIENLLDLQESLSSEYLQKFKYPWEALDGISEFIIERGKTLSQDYYQKGKYIWVHKSAIIAGTCSITGPCIIGRNTEVRQGAFIRGSALVGEECVVGNSTELKNVILFNRVQVPHYNYVGDSILGYGAHMGAGVITSNVKSDKKSVVIKHGDTSIETGRKKIGAILGDFVEVGCNTVLNPGTVIGKNSNIYPLSSVRGVVARNAIVKNMENIIIKEE